MSKRKPEFERPYQTQYFTDARVGASPVSRGSAKTLQGAKRSVSTNVFAFELYRCGVIIDRTTGLEVLRFRMPGRIPVVEYPHEVARLVRAVA